MNQTATQPTTASRLNPDQEAVITITAPQQAELLISPRDTQPLKPNEVAGRTLVSLISPGTELHSNYMGEKFPCILGYAACFEVEAVGSEVSDVKPGDIMYCTGPQGIGGHRSHQRCPREAALHVPQGLAPEIAVHARLMAVSMGTLITTTARPGDRVLITGLGPVGHLAAQLFHACGYRIVAVDPVKPRRDMLTQKGIKDVREAVPCDELRKAQDVQLAVECAGHEQAVLDACRSVRKRGEVVIVGVPWKKRADIQAFDVMHAIFRGYVTLRSGWEWEASRYPADFRIGSVFNNMASALNWLADGRVNVDGLYAFAQPHEAQNVYQDLLHARTDSLTTLFDWRTLHE